MVAGSLTNVARYSGGTGGPRSTSPGKTGWSASGSPTTASADDRPRGPGWGLADRIAALDGTFMLAVPDGLGTSSRRGDPVRVVVADD